MRRYHSPKSISAVSQLFLSFLQYLQFLHGVCRGHGVLTLVLLLNDVFSRHVGSPRPHKGIPAGPVCSNTTPCQAISSIHQNL